MNMNETITLLQLTQGAKIVGCTYLLSSTGPSYKGVVNPFDDVTDKGQNSERYVYSRTGQAPVRGAAQGVYHFKNVLGLELVNGDIVAVHSRDSMSLVVVEDPDVAHYEVGCDLGDLKHVIAKVDRTAYDKMKELEHKAKHRLSMSELDERLRKFTENTTGLDSVKGMFALSNDSVVDSPNLNEEAT